MVMSRSKLVAIKFVGVGILNTLIGYGLIALFQVLFGNPYIANATGYSFAIIISYFLHSRLTFNASSSKKSAILFILGMSLAYLVNICILRILLSLHVNVYASQLGSIIAYTICSFEFNRRVVFTHTRSTSRQ